MGFALGQKLVPGRTPVVQQVLSTVAVSNADAARKPSAEPAWVPAAGAPAVWKPALEPVLEPVLARHVERARGRPAAELSERLEVWLGQARPC